MANPEMITNVTILGATGSIGLNTIDVIEQHPLKFTVYALTANTQYKKMFELCKKLSPKFAVMGPVDAAHKLQVLITQEGLITKVLHGNDSLEKVASDTDVHAVMAAIVGAAGLRPTLAAVKAGKKILLANKEALVMSGALFMAEVAKSGSELIPIDSEHNAIFQCLPDQYKSGQSTRHIRRILLTASGGPFRKTTYENLLDVTPEQACAHPNWDMGKKISVDSATLMNKGLELIEACWLFNTDPENIQVHVHPESIIHSMVEYEDGTVLAQMGSPDMRTPIAYGLAWPERIESGVKSLDLFEIASLHFEKPDLNRFPALTLAADAFKAGGTAPAVLNASNEIAVAAFLDKKIGFLDIPRVVSHCLEGMPVTPADNLDQIFNADEEARHLAREFIENGIKLS